jgi:head-tail adaptor
MKKRWKDRIKILEQTSGTYDAWGHSSAESWTETKEIWADVRPQLSTHPTAIVTVRSPFDATQCLRIKWCDKLWQLVQAPICFPETQCVQFKIEQL